MSKPRTPPSEQFVKLPRELLESEAWRHLGINARRFIDFLMLEHLRHGGRHNGKLVAPYTQLQTFGISNRTRVAQAIHEAEAAGLVDCHRSGMRTATTYTLNWLPRYDSAPPNGTWKTWRRPETASAESKNLVTLPAPAKSPTGGTDRLYLVTLPSPDGSKRKSPRG
jgi:hypothetical protein